MAALLASHKGERAKHKEKQCRLKENISGIFRIFYETERRQEIFPYAMACNVHRTARDCSAYLLGNLLKFTRPGSFPPGLL